MIKVLFFAKLRETLDCAELAMSAEGSDTTESLRRRLISDHPAWQEALSDEQLLVAVNQQLCTEEQALQDGDELAFFPPVTGG